MSSSDETIVSKKPEAQTSGRRKMFVLGGIGCLFLICAFAAIAAAFYFWAGPDSLPFSMVNQEETATPPPEIAATTESTPTLLAPTSTASPSPSVVAEIEVESPTPPSGGAEEPEIGPITFARDAAPDSYEPIGAALSFEEPITEVHAIFDYSGLSPQDTWQRVWFLDGEEILRSPRADAPPENWSGEEYGRFDYFINNGGEPLPAGEWVLKIFVNEELLATGAFSIEGEGQTPVAQGEESPTPTLSPTATPTLSPTARPTLPSVAVSTPTPAPAQMGGGVYQLVFTRWDGGKHNLYVADTDGSNEQFLLSRAAGPSWTPDQESIFFYGEEGIDRQVIEGIEYVFDGISNGIVAMEASPLPASIDQVQLFQGLDWKQGSARWASVSPNGAMVAFDAQPGGNYRIYFLGTADNQQYRFEIVGEQADWSPDSEQIVYRSGRDGRTGIWVSNRNDTGHIQITGEGSDSFPAWSPDGSTIAFSRDAGGNVDIYTVDLEGTNLQRLTTAPGPDTLPTYTPSGDIIFRSARSGAWGVWKMGGTGANQTEIIPNAPVGPDWAYSKMDVQ